MTEQLLDPGMTQIELTAKPFNALLMSHHKRLQEIDIAPNIVAY